MNSIRKTGLKRQIIDKFYTSHNVAKQCMEYVKHYINIHDNDLCIEPSAGNGSFISFIKNIFKTYLFLDIQPEHNEIIKKDFLSFDVVNRDKYNKIHIIGNPPFGRQSSLAIRFIKKSSQFCDSISFILPKSFKKISLQKHFHLQFHLVFEYDLPHNSFIVDQHKYDVPCVFQIWIKKTSKRNIPLKQKPNQYYFVKKNEPHDISFRRVGVYAGCIDTKTLEKSEQSHYFIKFRFPFTNTLYNKLSKIDFDCKNNTCGPKSISKQELIKEYNKVISNIEE